MAQVDGDLTVGDVKPWVHDSTTGAMDVKKAFDCQVGFAAWRVAGCHPAIVVATKRHGTTRVRLQTRCPHALPARCSSILHTPVQPCIPSQTAFIIVDLIQLLGILLVRAAGGAVANGIERVLDTYYRSEHKDIVVRRVAACQFLCNGSG